MKKYLIFLISIVILFLVSCGMDLRPEEFRDVPGDTPINESAVDKD